MTTGLSYNGSITGTVSYLEQVATLAVVPQTDPNFVAITPAMITYAENRIYRDLDFLSTVSSNTSYAATVGTRAVNIPASLFVTLQQINVITPATATDPDLGTRNPLLPVTLEYMNAVWPSSASAGVPQWFAMFNQNTVLLGPFPDAAYTLELVGTTRPDSLSSTNQTTFISLYLPDLMIMASMVYLSAYQRNFSGAASNDPNMPVTYESQYQTLLKGATVEEARKKFQSSAWTSQSPAVVASPGRG